MTKHLAKPQARYRCTFTHDGTPEVGEVTEKAKDLICDEFNDHLCDCALITEAESTDNSDEANKVLYLLLPAVSAPIVLVVMILLCVCWCKGRNQLKLKENIEGGVALEERGQEDQRGQCETDHDYDSNRERASVGSGVGCGPLSSDREFAKLSPSKLVFNRGIEKSNSFSSLVREQSDIQDEP